jgi:hypothetical protein
MEKTNHYILTAILLFSLSLIFPLLLIPIEKILPYLEEKLQNHISKTALIMPIKSVQEVR